MDYYASQLHIYVTITLQCVSKIYIRTKHVTTVSEFKIRHNSWMFVHIYQTRDDGVRIKNSS